MEILLLHLLIVLNCYTVLLIIIITRYLVSSIVITFIIVGNGCIHSKQNE